MTKVPEVSEVSDTTAGRSDVWIQYTIKIEANFEEISRGMSVSSFFFFGSLTRMEGSGSCLCDDLAINR